MKRSREELERHISQLEAENKALDNYILDLETAPDPESIMVSKPAPMLVTKHESVTNSTPFDHKKHINAPLMHLNSLEDRLSYLERELGVTHAE